MKNEFAAVVLAAGQGSRLRPLTEKSPKCLVQFDGKCLLDYQLEAMEQLGIEDITVVAGYLQDKINREGVKKRLNVDYASTNMVHTLFCVRDVLDGSKDVIITYGDIIYHPSILESIIQCNQDICVSVDKSWLRYWEARMDDPLSDAETLKISENGLISEIGKAPQRIDEIDGQYMGIIKIKSGTVKEICGFWDSLSHSEQFDGESVSNMFMTTFLQLMIEAGYQIAPVIVNNGWLEVDCVQDLNLELKRFLVRQ